MVLIGMEEIIQHTKYIKGELSRWGYTLEDFLFLKNSPEREKF